MDQVWNADLSGGSAFLCGAANSRQLLGSHEPRRYIYRNDLIAHEETRNLQVLIISPYRAKRPYSPDRGAFVLHANFECVLLGNREYLLTNESHARLRQRFD